MRLASSRPVANPTAPYVPAVFLGPASLARPAEVARDRASTHAAALPAAAHRALLVGTSDPHVSSLLTDVLRDIQLDVRIEAPATGAPDVVLAMVDRVDGVRAITDAIARYPRAPVVAILTLGTHRLGTRAVSAGASACYMLDQPIDRLRGLINLLLSEPAPEPKKSRR
jgi:DNA-binding NarL/FixJ family response regulator